MSMVETETATTGVAGLALPVRGIAVPLPGSGTGVECVESDAIASDCVFFTGTATHKYSTILTTHDLTYDHKIITSCDHKITSIHIVHACISLISASVIAGLTLRPVG